MVGKTKPPTKSDLRRFQDLQDIGCIACLIDGRPGVPPDIHHGLRNGRRVGHQFTAPLCPWHHRAVVFSVVDWPLNADEMGRKYGPSLARQPAAFRHRYGTDEQLVARADEELARFRETIIGGARHEF